MFRKNAIYGNYQLWYLKYFINYMDNYLVINIILILLFILFLYLASMSIFQYLSTSSPNLMISSTNSMNPKMRTKIYFKQQG